MRVAVVGHVEWVDFALVDHVPVPGEIIHAAQAPAVPAGGGAVAAVQLARLAGECLFLTALGDDDNGHRAAAALEAMGVRVEAAWRAEPQRRAFVHLDTSAERTITVLGRRCSPRGGDPLPWSELADCDAVYVTAGDGAALRAARSARTVVATVRALESLREAAVELDVLLASSNDATERYEPGDLEPPPRAVARTNGAAGGRITRSDGGGSDWDPAPLPGPPVDSYGAGDSFAGGLTYGLADRRPEAAALELAARCGAACVSGRGPYEGQLRTAS